MSPLTRGWVVAFSGFGVNLTLGALFTWSVIARALTRSAAQGGQHVWTAQQANWPFVLAIGCFTLTMVLAGRLQDRIGPRWVTTAGGAMVGLGMIVASLSPAHLASTAAFPFRMALGFGVLTGVGIGLAFASATPAAVKWFPTGKKGLVAGIVVSGFGLASLYAAPLAAALVNHYGVHETFLFIGVVNFVVIVGLAQFIADPPTGYVPPGSYTEELPAVVPKPPAREYTWRQMMCRRSFYVLWAMYACAAFAGLLVTGVVAHIASARLVAASSPTLGYLLVAAFALGSGIGAPLSGLVSDRFGRQHSLLAVLTFQAALMAGLRFATSAPLFACCVFFIGFNYGASLTLFPTTTFDFFGTKNGGVDYGLLFTAWGVGGVLGLQAAAWAMERSSAANPGGSDAVEFAVAALLCLAAAGLTFILRPPDPTGEHCPVVQPGAARQA